jgi:hypothetical protein
MVSVVRNASKRKKGGTKLYLLLVVLCCSVVMVRNMIAAKRNTNGYVYAEYTSTVTVVPSVVQSSSTSQMQMHPPPQRSVSDAHNKTDVVVPKVSQPPLLKIMEEVVVTENNEIQTKKNETRLARPRVILHVGPGKTGTSSIQEAIYWQDEKVLKLDNFYQQRIVAFPLSFPSNPKDSDEKIKESVLQILEKDNFLEKMAFRAAQGHNVIISHEFLGNIPRANIFIWEKLRQVLDPFDTQVVVTYRRFYEWWLSMYAQNAARSAKTENGLASFAVELNRTMVAARLLKLNPEHPNFPFGGPEEVVHPTQKQMNLYKEKGFPNVTIFNMHDLATKDDLVPEFYCHSLGETSHTCHSMRSATTRTVWHENRGDLLWEYDRIAQAFLQKASTLAGGATEYGSSALLTRAIQLRKDNRRQNRIVSDIPITPAEMHDALTMMIHKRQETTLNRTTQDFPMTCMSRDQAHVFLDISLRMEKEILPDYYASSNGEQQHRREFEKSFQSHQFCNVDVVKVVEDDSWRDFVSMELNISNALF